MNINTENKAQVREPTPSWMREKVFKRDNYTCRYCSSKDGPFHADHVYPVSKGGETTVNNLVTACSLCNLKKSNRVGVWPMSLDEIKLIEKTLEQERIIAANKIDQEKQGRKIELFRRIKADARAAHFARDNQKQLEKIQDLSKRINRPAPMIWFWFVMTGVACDALLVLKADIAARAPELIAILGIASIVLGWTINFTWENKS